MSSLLRENRALDMLSRRIDDRDLDDGDAWSFEPDAPQEVLAFDATDAVSQAAIVEASAKKAGDLVAQIEALQRSGARFFDRVDGVAAAPYAAAEAAADHAQLVSQLEAVERGLCNETLEHLPLHPAVASATEEAQLTKDKAKTDAALRLVSTNARAYFNKLGPR
jgi:hypothetical protein